MKKISTIGVAFLILFSGCAMIKGNPNELHYVLNSKKPSCEISLPSNPTTGYGWTALYDKHAVTATNQYKAPQAMLAGAGGTDVWIFTATEEAIKSNRPVKAVVRMIYSRPWEKDIKPAATKIITLMIY